jgi:two-component system LytT family response regulator
MASFPGSVLSCDFFKEQFPDMKQEYTPIAALIISPNADVLDQLHQDIGRQHGMQVVGTATNGEMGIQEIRTKHPNLVLLDLDVEDIAGFEVLQKAPVALRPQFVVISSRPDDAVKAFEYSACDFLLKPLSRDRMQLSWIKVRDKISQDGSNVLHEKLNALFRYINPASSGKPDHRDNGFAKMVPVKMSGRIYFLQSSDIEYVEAAGYYIEVFAGGKKHLIRQSLTQLDGILDSRRFIRIHRSVIINLSFLKEIVRDGANDFSARMSNDASFKISRSYKSQVFEKIGL